LVDGALGVLDACLTPFGGLVTELREAVPSGRRTLGIVGRGDETAGALLFGGLLLDFLNDVGVLGARLLLRHRSFGLRGIAVERDRDGLPVVRGIARRPFCGLGPGLGSGCAGLLLL